jgi:N-methylhydantoinase A
MASSGVSVEAAVKNSRKLYFQEYGEWKEVPVYDRNKMFTGHQISGPAVIEERITTIVVHPGWNARIDEFANVVMEMK